MTHSYNTFNFRVNSLVLSFFLSILAVSFVQAQTTSLLDHWEGEEMIKMEIESDFTQLIADKKSDEYQKATIKWKESDGSKYAMDIKVKPRGKYRRRVCGFPPLKIKFKKDDLAALGFEREFNTFKLVTHCIDDKIEANQNVLKEYLAYKMYNELSENSFRVQLVQVTYKDTGSSDPKIVRYGFLIEKKSELAHRVGAVKKEMFNPSPDMLAYQEEMMMATFQYMIGNEDYDMAVARNVVLLQRPDGLLMPVPYDFDFSGLVNAAYAIPRSDYKLPSVQDRIYLGYENDPQACELVSEHFLSKQASIYALIDDQIGLTSSTKKQVKRYLDTFYDSLNNNPTQTVLKPFATYLMEGK